VIVAAPSLSGKKVTVVGLARSGGAAARLCLREGARVTVTDRRGEAELAGALEGLHVRRRLGGHDLAAKGASRRQGADEKADRNQDDQPDLVLRPCSAICPRSDCFRGWSTSQASVVPGPHGKRPSR